jgi:hypothetical protein
MIVQPGIPALGRLRQEDPKFEASVGYGSETLSQTKEKRKDHSGSGDSSL